MPYKALDVARYVVNYGREKGHLISNLKLQKILYFIQASFLVEKEDNSICFEDNIEAWDFGPVVPNAYHEFKKYGAGSIPEIKDYIDSSDGIWGSKKKRFEKNIICDEDQILINEVVDEAASYSARALVDITHIQAPWADRYSKGSNNIITNDSIKEYFLTYNEE